MNFAGILYEVGRILLEFCRNFVYEVYRNLPSFAKIQNPAVTADKLQSTPDHMPNAALLASSSARPAAALRDIREANADCVRCSTRFPGQMHHTNARVQRSNDSVNKLTHAKP